MGAFLLGVPSVTSFVRASAGVRYIAARSRPARYSATGFITFFPAANSPQEHPIVGAFFAWCTFGNELRARERGSSHTIEDGILRNAAC